MRSSFYCPLPIKAVTSGSNKPTAAGCVFQATPPVITSGASSTLSWCPVAGLTYRISPGPGIVTGGSLSRVADHHDRLHAHRQQRVGCGNEFHGGHCQPVRLREREQLERHADFYLHAGAVSAGLQFQHQPRTRRRTFHLTPFGTGVFAFNGIRVRHRLDQ